MMAPSSEVSGQTTNSHKTDTSHSVGVKVTTKAESTGIVDNLELNPWYFKTVPGILKLVQLLFAIICMGCASPVVTSYTNFFMFVVAIYFIVTLVLCVVYFFSIKRLLPKVPWLIIDVLASGTAAVMYLIVSIAQLVSSCLKNFGSLLYYGANADSYIAAGCFGLFNFAVYVIGALVAYNEWREDS